MVARQSLEPCKQLARRCYRVFPHAYYHHREVFSAFEVSELAVCSVLLASCLAHGHACVSNTMLQHSAGIISCRCSVMIVCSVRCQNCPPSSTPSVTLNKQHRRLVQSESSVFRLLTYVCMLCVCACYTFRASGICSSVSFNSPGRSNW